MANGQQITSARGSVSKVLSVALVGLVMTASSGTFTGTGDNRSLLLDDFTDANGTTLQAHTSRWAKIEGTGDVTIASNQATSAPDGTHYNLYSWNQQPGNTCQVLMTITNTGSGDNRYLALGFMASQSPFNAYFVTSGGDPINGWYFAIERYDAGVKTVLASGTHAWATNDRLQLQRQGTRFIGLMNEISILDVTDSTYPNLTYLLFGTGHDSLGSDIRFDDFSGGPFPLTSATITLAHGTLTPARTRALSGLELHSFQGTPVAQGRSLLSTAQGTIGPPTLTIPLVPSVIQISPGLIFANNNDGTVGPLVGLSLTGEQGSMIPPGSFELIGSEITSEAGTLTTLLRPTDIVGQAVLSGIGILTVLGQDVTVNISGIEFAVTQGSVDPRTALVGQSMTSAHGSLVYGSERALVGLAASLIQGPIQIGQDPEDTKILSLPGFISLTSRTVPLLGSPLTSIAGTIGTTPDIFQPLTGSGFISSRGTMASAQTYALIGSETVVIRGTIGAPGQVALTGHVVMLAHGSVFTNNDRQHALIGLSSPMSIQSVLPALVLSPVGLNLQVSGGVLSTTGTSQQRALTGQQMTSATSPITASGGEVRPPGPGTNEGCHIVSEIAEEGCGIVSGIEVEERPTIFGWGNLPWGDEWGGKEVSQTVSGIAREVVSG